MAYAEKRGGGRWRGRYKLPNGKYGTVSEDADGVAFTTKLSAKKFAADLESDVRRQSFINPADGKITVEEWSDLWLGSIDVGPLSDRNYRQRLRTQIIPEWGAAAVRDVSAHAVAAWEKRLRKALSKNYADAVMSTFRTLMDDAVASRLRGDNPVTTRKSRRRGKYQPKPKDEKVIATPRQALLVARNAHERWGFGGYVLVLTIAYTGMRIGEIAGLRREFLLLRDAGAGRRILVERQSQYVDGKLALIDPKYASQRSLILPPFLADLLEELAASHRHDHVFAAVKGGQILAAGDFYSTYWHPAVDGLAPRGVVRGAKARAGIRPVLGVADMVPHGLRHSHKVWLDEDGHPRVAVEERMGHELPGVEGTYSHTTLPMELKIAETLQGRWEQSLRPVVDRREFGPYPPVKPSRRRRSPKFLPAED